MQLVFAVLIPGLQLHLQCIKRPPTEAFSHVTCIDATDVVSEKIEQSVFLKLNITPCLQGSVEVVIIDTCKVAK